MRLIDADVAKENVVKAILGNSEFAQDTRNACYETIDDAPTVDAALVVHGEWILSKVEHYKCSECDFCVGGVISPYCPNCGAKMGKVTDTDDHG